MQKQNSSLKRAFLIWKTFAFLFIVIGLQVISPVLAATPRACPATLYIDFRTEEVSPLQQPAMQQVEQMLAGALKQNQLKHVKFLYYSDTESILSAETSRQEALKRKFDAKQISAEEYYQLSTMSKETEKRLHAGTSSDFFISAWIRPVGSRLVVAGTLHRSDGPMMATGRNGESWFNMSYQAIDRFSANYSQPSELPGIIQAMAAKFSESLADKFYCVSIEPNPIPASAAQPNKQITAKIVDLKDRPVTKPNKTVQWKVSNPEAGVVNPTKTALENGKAKPTYNWKKTTGNVVEATIQAEPASGIPGIITRDTATVGPGPKCFLLKFSGGSSMDQYATQVKNGQWRFESQVRNNGEIPICISDETINPQDYASLVPTFMPLANMAQGMIDNFKKIPGGADTVAQIQRTQAPDNRPYQTAFGDGDYRSYLVKNNTDVSSEMVTMQGQESGSTATGKITIKGKVIENIAYLDFEGNAEFDKTYTMNQEVHAGGLRQDMSHPMGVMAPPMMFSVVIPLQEGASTTARFNPKINMGLQTNFDSKYQISIQALRPDDPRYAKAAAKQDPQQAMAKLMKPGAWQKQIEQLRNTAPTDGGGDDAPFDSSSDDSSENDNPSNSNSGNYQQGDNRIQQPSYQQPPPVSYYYTPPEREDVEEPAEDTSDHSDLLEQLPGMIMQTIQQFLP